MVAMASDVISGAVVVEDMVDAVTSMVQIVPVITIIEIGHI